MAKFVRMDLVGIENVLDRGVHASVPDRYRIEVRGEHPGTRETLM